MSLFDERNDYDYPTVEETQSLSMALLGFELIPEQQPTSSKFEAARQYAAQVRERNKPPCQCDACVREVQLESVLNILEARRIVGDACHANK